MIISEGRRCEIGALIWIYDCQHALIAMEDEIIRECARHCPSEMDDLFWYEWRSNELSEFVRRVQSVIQNMNPIEIKNAYLLANFAMEHSDNETIISWPVELEKIIMQDPYHVNAYIYRLPKGQRRWPEYEKYLQETQALCVDFDPLKEQYPD